MKIAAVVILYHPNESAITNIKTYYEYVDKIFVFDNSEVESLVKDDLVNLPKVEFYQNFENEGIAKRLNEGCKLAMQEHFDWILTMDQDSTFSKDAINYYFNCFKQFKEKENTVMIGTNRSREITLNTKICKPQQTGDLITSGSLLNLKAFEKVGDFDESLFIDLIDNEYCARAKMAGYSVIRFLNIYIIHELGKQVYHSSIKSFFIVKKKKEIHSPLRCYYMYRNMLYLENKYKDSNKDFTQTLSKDVKARIKICILYGRETRKILKYLKAAKDDFKNNKMGKIRQEL